MTADITQQCSGHNGFSDILFDLDGTLTDPKQGITRCIRFALERMGGPVPPADSLTWCIGPPLKSSFSAILDTDDEAVLNRALALYRERFARIGMYENAVYPDVVPALASITEAGYRVFLATSKPRVFAERILDHFHLTRYFSGIYGSEFNGDRVDKGELIAHLMAAEALDRSRALMVGDRRHDIDGAKKNGVPAAAVMHGYGSAQEIQAAGPDMIFDNVGRLADYLAGGRRTAADEPPGGRT